MKKYISVSITIFVILVAFFFLLSKTAYAGVKPTQPGNAVAAAAVTVAGKDGQANTPYYSQKCPPPKAAWSNWYTANNAIPASQYGKNWGYRQKYHAECSKTVSLIVWLSGVDDTFSGGTTVAEYSYMKSHPSKWKLVGSYSRKKNSGVALQPGDVLITSTCAKGQGGHILVYAGKNVKYKYPKSSHTVVESAQGGVWTCATSLKNGDSRTYHVFRPLQKPTGKYVNLLASEKAKYSSEFSYTVTFKDGYSDKTLKTQTVNQGQNASAPAAPKRSGYTFVKWDVGYSNVQANITVKALWRKTTNYSILYKDLNGASAPSLKTFSSNSGTKIPNPGARKGYSFAGWYKGVLPNGTYVIKSALDNSKFALDVAGGSTADKANVQIYQNNNSAAQQWVITNTSTGYSIKNVRSSKMLDIAGGTISSGTNIQQYSNNNSIAQRWAIVPSGNSFSILVNSNRDYGLDVASGKAANNTNVQLYWRNHSAAQKYDMFLLKNGTTTKVSTTASSTKIVSIPKNTYEDFALHAKWTPNVLTVNYYANGATSDTQSGKKVAVKNQLLKTVKYNFDGSDFSKYGLPNAHGGTWNLVKDGYKISNTWLVNSATSTKKINADTKFAKVQDLAKTAGVDLTSGNKIINLYAEFVPLEYTVSFNDGTGKVINTQKVKFNQPAKAPANPKRTGYTFVGWDKKFDKITNNLTVTAKWAAVQASKYNVVFKDGYTSNVLKTQAVEKGKAATAPSNPTRSGYVFAGWDKPFTNITADTTITAKWTAVSQTVEKYTVVFKDGVDNKVIKTQSVEKGKSATAPTPPVHSGFSFSKWDKAFTNIVANTTITAIYTKDTTPVVVKPANFTVTFKDGVDNKILKTQIVESGKSATAPALPAHNGYTFSKWDKTFNNISSDLTVIAIYTKDVTSTPTHTYYTVVFKDGLTNSIIKSESVISGSSATAPIIPAHDGYKFSGWSGSYTNVKANTTVVANYVKDTTSSQSGSSSSMTSIRSGWWAADSNGVKVDSNYRVAYTGKFLNPISYITNGSIKIFRPSYSPYFFKNKEPGKSTVMIRGNRNKNYRDSFWTSFTIVAANKLDLTADNNATKDNAINDVEDVVIENQDDSEEILGWECVDEEQRLYRYYDVVSGLLVQDQEYYVTLSEPGIDDPNPGIRRFDENGYMVFGEYVDSVTGDVSYYAESNGIKII